MSNKLAIVVTSLLVSMAASTIEASAAPIEGLGSPLSAVPGGTLVDFESVPVQNHTTLTVGDLTISAGGETFQTSSTFSGQFNTTGVSVYSPPDVPEVWRFDFASAVDAFAFNMGAHDRDWTLRAFDAADALVESLVIAGIGGNTLGQFYGIAASGIAYATLTNNTDIQDFMFIDNVVFSEELSVQPVPLPAALPLFAGALGLMGFIGWRRKRIA